jgi:hypothetical protein
MSSARTQLGGAGTQASALAFAGDTGPGWSQHQQKNLQVQEQLLQKQLQ